MVVGLESVKNTSFLKGGWGSSFLGGCFSLLVWRPRYFHFGWLFMLFLLSVPHGSLWPNNSLIFSNINKAGATTGTALVAAINTAGSLVQKGSSKLQQQAMASNGGTAEHTIHATAKVTAEITTPQETSQPVGKSQLVQVKTPSWMHH